MHYKGGAGEHIDTGDKFPVHLSLPVVHPPVQQRQLTPFGGQEPAFSIAPNFFPPIQHLLCDPCATNPTSIVYEKNYQHQTISNIISLFFLKCGLTIDFRHTGF